jgi:predicted nuclease of restriction endonuclease-like (RecB) superfamily
MSNKPIANNLFNDIKKLIIEAKSQIYSSVNTTMTTTYWNIGRKIVEEEQEGKERAEYGKALLKKLSIKLTKEFKRGYSEDNLKNMRRFYIAYSKSETLSHKFKLSWSHYIFLTRISDIEERNFYELEAVQGSLSIREIKRQFDSGLYQRLQLSIDKNKVETLSEKGQIIESVDDLIKDPYIFEFLDLPIHKSYSESQLEEELIDKLEAFLLELGRGFTFVARQKRITIDEEHFAVDLVFYNRFLRSFVLIDLKIGKLKHQDIGQMMMYVNHYDRVEKQEDEHPTVGIILCRDKSKALVEMTLPKDNNQIYASKYLTVLPDKEEFRRLLEEKSMDDGE